MMRRLLGDGFNEGLFDAAPGRAAVAGLGSRAALHGQLEIDRDRPSPEARETPRVQMQADLDRSIRVLAQLPEVGRLGERFFQPPGCAWVIGYRRDSRLL